MVVVNGGYEKKLTKHHQSGLSGRGASSGSHECAHVVP